ncbi:MAG: hypothetical protein GOU98_00900 [Candidatus Altiarchaeota archaeon]|nr:hypothetical protein [Candidatus Altiarchaeota archaeon]
MRIQNTSKNETASGKTFQGTLKLPASLEIYETLRPEGNIKYKNNEITITIKVETMRDLKAQVNSWLRLYSALQGIEEVSK